MSAFDRYHKSHTKLLVDLFVIRGLSLSIPVFQKLFRKKGGSLGICIVTTFSRESQTNQIYEETPYLSLIIVLNVTQCWLD